MAQNEWSQARLQTALENFLLGGALAPLTVRQLKIIRTKPSKRMGPTKTGSRNWSFADAPWWQYRHSKYMCPLV